MKEKNISYPENSGSCLIKIIHNGVVELVHPPAFGQVSLTFHSGKLKAIEETAKKRFE